MFEIEVITDQQQLVDVQFVEVHDLPDCPPAEVHIRLGGKKQHSLAIDRDLGHFRIELRAGRIGQITR